MFFNCISGCGMKVKHEALTCGSFGWLREHVVMVVGWYVGSLIYLGVYEGCQRVSLPLYYWNTVVWTKQTSKYSCPSCYVVILEWGEDILHAAFSCDYGIQIACLDDIYSREKVSFRMILPQCCLYLSTFDLSHARHGCVVSTTYSLPYVSVGFSHSFSVVVLYLLLL